MSRPLGRLGRTTFAAALWITGAAATQDPAVPPSPAIDALRAILGREVRDEAGVEAQRAEVRAWIAEHGAADLGEAGFLRAVAMHVAAADDAERAPAQDAVFRIVEAAGRLPVEGFEKAARRALLLHGPRFAENGEWDACREYLPFLTLHYDDHGALYWLVGRRARDHGSPEGKAFLHEVVVPALLLDPQLDDTDRVVELRRLWDVYYTGPRPFRHVEGPSLRDPDATVSSRSGEGKVMLVDYWATWCVPCLMEMPNVVQTWQRFQDDGLVVVSVVLDGAASRDKVLATVERLGMGWPQIFDGLGTKSDLMLRNRITAIPATFLIDRQGRVRWTGLEGPELAQRVAELLAEKQ